jgi:hypothetical protein
MHAYFNGKDTLFPDKTKLLAEVSPPIGKLHCILLCKPSLPSKLSPKSIREIYALLCSLKCALTHGWNKVFEDYIIRYTNENKSK